MSSFRKSITQKDSTYRFPPSHPRSRTPSDFPFLHIYSKNFHPEFGITWVSYSISPTLARRQEQVSLTAGVAVSHQPDFWDNYKTNVMSASVFQHHYETGSVDIMKHLSSMVSGIFMALTETKAAYAWEIHSSCHGVVSDFAYLLNDRMKILGEIKSPKVFNDTIGAFMQQISNESPVALCTESELTPYSGHLAIFGRVRALTSVSCLPSESSLPPAWIPRGRHSAPRPLDNRVQRTQLYHYLHPTDRKA